MRNVHKALTYLGFGSVVMGAAIHGIACANTAEDCNLLGELCSKVVSTATTGTGTGGNGTVNPLCEQDPTTNPDALSEECGYFVKAGAGAMGDGTKANPYGDLKSALAVAGSGTERKRVYVCQGDFSEAVVVQAGVSLYGGFDCTAGWAAPAADARTALTSLPDVVPIVFESGDGKATSHIEGFTVTAANATKAGGSSIAAIARNGAAVDIKNCSFTAGNGVNGESGADATTMVPPPPKGKAGTNASCTTEKNPGGEQHVMTCDDTHYSIGGQGGEGRPVNGGPGENGSAMPEPMQPAGAGGTGGMSCSGAGLGKPGANGDPGMPGAGGNSDGALSSEGWVGASGGDGQMGNPGQGGGGGAGQKHKMATGCAGASGGAGGAGGCGGAGGGGGQAGGSSIAFVSINATITMEGVTLTAGKGGDGGIGGAAMAGVIGAAGGAGGTNGGDAALIAGCSGGTGGNGGAGGPGGGGAGGHSLGIAFEGKALEGAPTITVAQPGIGGSGGNGGIEGNKGADGKAENILPFTAPSSN